jgi:MraZ protein
LWGEVVNRILTGTYERFLDDKLRLAIPKPLRKQFSQEEEVTLFVAPGTERSLTLYSREAFHDLAERLAQHATNRAESRNYLRLFYARAEEVAVDRQGRIRIPERLVEHAGLKHDLVLLGVQDHAEIWDKGLWEEFLAAHGGQFDEMASHAFG